MNDARVILFIVEGLSDQYALYDHLKRFIKPLGINFKVEKGDVITKTGNAKKSAITILDETIDDVLVETGFDQDDIAMIIHLADTDGIYIPNNSIISNGCRNEIHYSQSKIEVRNRGHKDDIEKRNRKRSNGVNDLIQTSIIKGIPYRILYFSRDLEHVIHDDIDAGQSWTPNIKCQRADEFSSGFNTTEEFIKFFDDPDFKVPGNYDETWIHAKMGTHSLERWSNFHLVFEIILDVISKK